MLKEQTGVTQAGEASLVWALTAEGTQGFYITGYSYDTYIGLYQ